MTFILPGPRALRYSLFLYEMKGNCWDKVTMKCACVVHTIKIKTRYSEGYMEKKITRWRIISGEKRRKTERAKERKKGNRRMLYHGKLYPTIEAWDINCLFVLHVPLLSSMADGNGVKVHGIRPISHENKARRCEFNGHGEESAG